MQEAHHMAKPTSMHMAAVKRILQYLRGTSNLATGIVYKRGSSLDLTGYCDASYGMGDPQTMRSTNGSMILAGGPTNSSSQLQKITAHSTTEAELIALNTCAKNGLFYLSRILGELGWPNVRSFRISSVRQQKSTSPFSEHQLLHPGQTHCNKLCISEALDNGQNRNYRVHLFEKSAC